MHFLLLISSIVLLISCNKKNRLTGKWNLIDEKVLCTKPVSDSLYAATKRGIYKPGELLLQEEVQNQIEKGCYFIFSGNSKYKHKLGDLIDEGDYEIKDSFLVTSSHVAGLSIVSGGYKVHFIDDNNLQLTEEMTIRSRDHVHTYTLILKKDPNY